MRLRLLKCVVCFRLCWPSSRGWWKTRRDDHRWAQHLGHSPSPHLACPISEERARVRRCGRVHVVSRDVWRAPKDRVDLVAQILAVPGAVRRSGLALTSTPTPLSVRASPDLRSVRQGDTNIGGAHWPWKRPVRKIVVVGLPTVPQ